MVVPQPARLLCKEKERKKKGAQRTTAVEITFDTVVVALVADGFQKKLEKRNGTHTHTQGRGEQAPVERDVNVRKREAHI